MTETDKDMFWHKRNGINTASNYTRLSSELSIFPVRTADEEKEDANLLPSKIKHKKSEIILLPVKKKSCGHYEPCENIVCDVTLQQYADKDGVSPMLALNIEEDEINAPVEKHCRNENCDALSIDHNRCRRALIKLHRCDRSHVCDICGVTLKEWISRIYHRNCTRKKEYIHNNVSRLHLQKERMRMRELQILEIARLKKHDYSDPTSVIDMLRKNEELVIIPQKLSSQRFPIVTTTSVSSTQFTSLNLTSTQSIKINSQITKTTNIFGSVPITVSSPCTVVSGNTSRLKSKVKSSQIKFSNFLGSTSISAPIQVQTQVPTTASAAVPVLTPVPTLTLAVAPNSASAPNATSATTSATTSVPTLTLTLAPISSTSTPVSVPTSVSTLALALASNSASVPNSTSTTTSATTSVPTLTLALAPTPVPTSASTSVPALTPISAPTSVTTSAPGSVVSSHKQYIRLAVSPQTTSRQPITINNWIVSPSQILTSTPIQPKTFLTPIRVVPITNLISQPSLLHRTQGIPKFCIVAENPATPVTKLQSIQPTSTAANTTPVQVNASNLLIRKPTSKERKTPNLMKAKKNFFCVYCSKNITTDWYFKMHIAKHKGEKLFFCSLCDESFCNNYTYKKHMTNRHTSQKELACNKCNYTCTSLASFKSHIQTHAIKYNLEKADVQSKKQRKLELLKDKISHKLIHNKYERKVKRIKCEDTSDNQDERLEHNNKELLTINTGGKAKTKEFNFVAVKKIVEPENFEQESAITSR